VSFFEELKRRNVFRVGIAYGVAAWLLIQITDTVFPRIGLSDSAVTLVIALLAIGLIPALIFAWAFEMTPEGLKRDAEVDRAQSTTPQTAKKLDRVIIAGLLLVIVAMGVERYWFAGQDEQQPRAQPAASAMTAADGSGDPVPGGPNAKHRESVAVLPFTAMSSGEDDGYFADGLTEEILNSLAALPDLLVTARTSSFHFKDRNLPVQEIAATLGVDNIVEGSVRRSGDRVRITAQLIRAQDGFHLWSNTYNRTLEDVFAVQENIAVNIAETLDVVLNEDRRRNMRDAGIGNVEAFVAYQKGIEAFARAHSVDDPLTFLPEANAWFDRALAIAPDAANAHFLRTDLFGHIIYNNGNGRRPESLPELEAARAEILASLEQAMQSSGHRAQRAMFDAERTLFTDNWTSLPVKIEAAFQPNDCTPTNWVVSAAMVFGWAEQAARHGHNVLRCDPISSVSVWALSQVEIWNLEPETALVVTERFLNERPFEPWVDDMRFTALQATGKYREDPRVYEPNPQGSFYSVPRKLFIYALEGDVEQARAVFDAFLADSQDVDELTLMAVEAALGNRQAVNEYASRIDARFAGPFMLIEAAKNCFCGAPFDIEVTPNFKARIEEAGFTWPPASPIQYPAKDW